MCLYHHDIRCDNHDNHKSVLTYIGTELNNEIINIRIREAIDEYHAVSPSYLQRVCKISYANAVKCIEIWIENNMESEDVN